MIFTAEKLNKLIARWQNSSNPEVFSMELALARQLLSIMKQAGTPKDEPRPIGVRWQTEETPTGTKIVDEEPDDDPHGIFKHLFNPDGTLTTSGALRRL